MQMVEQFEVELSKYQFCAGETVYGTITLQSNQTVKVSQFYSIIKGEGRVKILFFIEFLF